MTSRIGLAERGEVLRPPNRRVRRRASGSRRLAPKLDSEDGVKVCCLQSEGDDVVRCSRCRKAPVHGLGRIGEVSALLSPIPSTKSIRVVRWVGLSCCGAADSTSSPCLTDHSGLGKVEALSSSEDAMAEIGGIEHLNLSVRNIQTSTAWYVDLFGFEKICEEDSEEHGWTKIRLYHAPSQLRLNLTEHRPRHGEAFSEFCTGLDHLAFCVPGGRPALEAWLARLSERGVEHSAI